MIKDIFPTRIIVDQLSQDDVFELANKFAEHGEKDWEKIVDDPEIVLRKIRESFGGEYTIVDGWVRVGYNSFDLHCDSHYGNQLVCVVQLYGNEECGGDLVLYDPSWRNPQWTSDVKQVDANTEVVKFKVGQFVVFPSDVWHRVTEYTGSISRITLNLMIKRIL